MPGPPFLSTGASGAPAVAHWVLDPLSTSVRRGSGTHGANPGAPAAQRRCLSVTPQNASRAPVVAHWVQGPLSMDGHRRRAAGAPGLAPRVPDPLRALVAPQNASGAPVVAHWVLGPLGTGRQRLCAQKAADLSKSIWLLLGIQALIYPCMSVMMVVQMDTGFSECSITHLEGHNQLIPTTPHQKPCWHQRHRLKPTTMPIGTSQCGQHRWPIKNKSRNPHDRWINALPGVQQVHLHQNAQIVLQWTSTGHKREPEKPPTPSWGDSS